MLSRIAIVLTLSVLVSPVFADDSPNVQQGANKYDWQTCVADKTDDCINTCQNSEDINCQNNCKQLASDKCQEIGLSPSNGL